MAKTDDTTTPPDATEGAPVEPTTEELLAKLAQLEAEKAAAVARAEAAEDQVAILEVNAEEHKNYAPVGPDTRGDSWPLNVHIGAGVTSTWIDGVDYTVDPETGNITGKA